MSSSGKKIFDQNVEFKKNVKFSNVTSSSAVDRLLALNDQGDFVSVLSSDMPILNQDTTGNAATATLAADATTLATPRTINGVNFDGSASITIAAAGSTLSDTVTVSKGGTGAVSLTNNAVLTGSTQAAITAESTLSYTNETLTIGADDGGEAIIVRKASSGSGKALTIKAGNSAASGTSLGGNLNLYGGASCGTAGGGQIKFFSTPGGTESSGVVGTHVEIAALNSGGSLQIDGGLTVGSTSFVNSSGVVQVATQGTIDHDSLANFVTAEHVDWAGASAGTIHSSNIPTLNQNTTGNAATATNLTASTSTAVGLGTIELGHASDTTIARSAAGEVTIEGAPIQTTQMSVTNHAFALDANNSAYNYFPLNNLNETRAGDTAQYYARLIAPYAGKVLRVVVRATADMGDCRIRLTKLSTSGQSVDGLRDEGTDVETTDAVDCSAINTTQTFNLTAAFAAGDVVNVGILKGSTNTAFVTAAVVWEYTV